MLKLASNNKGYVAVLAGCSLFIFLSLFALVADLGYIYVAKAELQNTADAAAFAGASELPSETAARAKALAFGESHHVAGERIQIDSSDVRFGRYNFLTASYELEESPANFIRVTARRVKDSPSGALPLFFATLFGKNESNVQAESKVVLDNHINGVRGKTRLLPYSVAFSVVDADLDGQFDLGTTLDIYPKKNAPGNFGFLDLDGGSNDTPELRYYIENGYDQDFIIPPGGTLPVGGTPGIRGDSVLTSFKVIIGDVVFLPVHLSVTGTGSTAIYNVFSILAVRITDVNLTGNQDSRYIRTEIISFSSSLLVTDPAAPENNSLAKPRLVA